MDMAVLNIPMRSPGLLFPAAVHRLAHTGITELRVAQNSVAAK